MEQNRTQSRRKETISQDTGLTSNQEKAVMLIASGLRITDVAEQMQISRGTLYRWMNKKAFQCYLNLLKQDVKNYVEGSILELNGMALNSIKTCLDSDTEAIKLKASMWVLEKINQMNIGITDVRELIKENAKYKPDWGYNDRIASKLEEEGIPK